MRKPKRRASVLLAFVLALVMLLPSTAVFASAEERFIDASDALQKQVNFSPAYLETLSNEELRELYEPFWAIAEMFNEYKLTSGWTALMIQHPLDNADVLGNEPARELTIYTIANHTIETYELKLSDQLELLRGPAHFIMAMEILTNALMADDLSYYEFRAIQNNLRVLTTEEIVQAAKVLTAEGISSLPASVFYERDASEMQNGETISPFVDHVIRTNMRQEQWSQISNSIFTDVVIHVIVDVVRSWDGAHTTFAYHRFVGATMWSPWVSNFVNLQWSWTFNTNRTQLIITGVGLATFNNVAHQIPYQTTFVVPRF